MAYRPTWQGHLKLSLVTCPVALYTATNAGGDVHFNLINPKTNNRIKMITTDPETGPVERSIGPVSGSVVIILIRLLVLGLIRLKWMSPAELVAV